MKETDESFRDSIATVDSSGKRIWIYPKKPKGKYYNWRTWLSWVLLAFLFGMPFIKMNGEPFLLFNIIERKFIIFGLYFAPQDFHLFVLAMLIFIIFIALFTVVFGRLFCGWVCPQTIFMEMVFRKIEYWIEGDANAQRRLNKADWSTDKVFKKSLKHFIFFMIAVLVANTFLSYIIGLDQVKQIIFEPISAHIGGFIAMILFSFAFYGVFAWLREQVCVTICPYGRLQSVLLDQDSIVVAYDFVRGEPRGKKKRAKKLKTTPVIDLKSGSSPSLDLATAAAPTLELGDCIDCKLCIKVCPTGIDIRNGTQLECVNCTACMDACDEIMEKVDRPTKLIRYDSYNGIANKQQKIWTPRVKAYLAALVALLALEVFLLAQRNDVETLLLRAPGMMYQKVDDNTYNNLYNYHIINKTTKELNIEFKLKTEKGNVKLVGEQPIVPEKGEAEGALFIELPKELIDGRKTQLEVEVYSHGKLIDEVNTTFFGPLK